MNIANNIGAHTINFEMKLNEILKIIGNRKGKKEIFMTGLLLV